MTEKKTRDKAVKNLAGFLSEAPEDALSELEMDKLWKGIFYCELYRPWNAAWAHSFLNRFLDVGQALGAAGFGE